MCEGLSTINGPIPPHPMFLKDSTSLSLPASARNESSLCEGPSKLSGPIASHFSEKNDQGPLDFSKNPRVRNAGKVNFDANKNGNGVALLIHLQGKAIIPQTFRMREPPKNHIAANTIKVKQLMRKVKEREAQKEKQTLEKNLPVKALWKSDKYKDVQSKLKEILLQQPDAPRDGNKFFLRAHSRTGSISRPQTARQASEDEKKAAIESNRSARSKDDIDFVKHNLLMAKQVQMRRAPSLEMLKQVQNKLNTDLEKYNNKIKGKVPKYLEQRKEDAKKEQEDYLKNMPDPDQPAGHRKLPENEKEETLNKLKETHKNLLAQLNSMPIRTDTLKLQKTKSDIEQRLVELDEAIKIFSKPKVFVKLDN